MVHLELWGMETFSEHDHLFQIQSLYTLQLESGEQLAGRQHRLSVMADLGISRMQFCSVSCCSVKVHLFFRNLQPFPVWRGRIMTSAKIPLLPIEWNSKEHGLSQGWRLANHPPGPLSMTSLHRLIALRLLGAEQIQCGRCYKPLRVSSFPKFPVKYFLKILIFRFCRCGFH